MKTVFAHETESSGGISAQMHIDPADHPFTGSEAKFFFTFTDPEGNFDIAKCNCMIMLEDKNGQMIDHQTVIAPKTGFAAVGTSPLYTHNFSEAGDYKLHFDGSPKDGATFQDFDLDFDVHVAQAGSTIVAPMEHSSFAHQHTGHAVIFGGGLIAAIGLLIYTY